MRTTRSMIITLVTIVLLSQAMIGSAIAHPDKPGAANTDWSQAVVESTIKRFPAADSLKGWGYAKSLYLYGQYLVYLRTHDRRYLDHIKAWIDLHIDDKGVINRPIDALDYMLPAQNIRTVFDTYPRTSDGGFWHAKTVSRNWQLWADGVFMSLPFLVRYGQMFGDSAYTNAEATKQMLIYYKHLNDPATGLLWHAYDESGKQTRADPATHHSAFHWGRAFGWYAMTLIELLEVMPKNQPNQRILMAIINQLAKAFEKFQDPKTGLWYQVVDKGDVEGNWLETSCSSMYTYMMWMGVKRGYLAKHYADVAQKGYQGVLTKLSLGSDGLTNLIDISEGTNVSDLAYYFARKRNTNDFHGVGAFLIMNEQLGAASIGYKPKPLSWKAD